MKVTEVCKKKSLHSASAYELTKNQYENKGVKKYQMHLENAAEVSKERKKILE